MMPFFNRNWAGVCWGRWAGPGLLLGWAAGFWIVGLKYDCCSAGLQALDVALLYKKIKKEGGSAGASPVAAPMPKSVSF